MATAKRKVAKSSKAKTKSVAPKKRKSLYEEGIEIEHDLVIIAGGGLLVMVLVTLLVFGII